MQFNSFETENHIIVSSSIVLFYLTFHAWLFLAFHLNFFVGKSGFIEFGEQLLRWNAPVNDGHLHGLHVAISVIWATCVAIGLGYKWVLW